MKILLVNRHMNIGGVETYLYRLCAGLHAKGHQVGLLTEGGLYEGKALEAGAKLHKVRSLSNGWQSALPELRQDGYELVHAHNYHSARVGRRLSKELGARFLMSVHGPRPRLKQLLFRDWSDPVIVMSEGDRDNIRWFGGVPDKQIILSFYAIDTDRFHPGIEVEELRKELGLPLGAKTVVFISRFSNRKADVGHALLDALPALTERVSNMQLLLVGEGPEGEKLRAHISALGTKFPGVTAKMIGPRKDVERFMNLADVAICTANTALEALACGAPTIAAGRTGFFGLVDTRNIEKARSICFADHGRSPFTMKPSLFIDLVPRLLSCSKDAREAALKASEYVAQNYSIARMTDQMEQIYRRCLNNATSRP